MSKEIGPGITAVFCARVGDPTWKETGGSSIDYCYNCENPIHVSACTVEIGKHHKQVCVCLECIPQYNTRKLVILPSIPAQVRENPDRKLASKEEFVNTYVKLHSLSGVDEEELKKEAVRIFEI